MILAVRRVETIVDLTTTLFDCDISETQRILSGNRGIVKLASNQ